MRTIWKFAVPSGTDGPLAPVPENGKIVHVDMDPASVSPAVWIECDDTNPVKERRFGFFGTGHPLPEGWEHVGSCIAVGGFVWHVFEGPTR